MTTIRWTSLVLVLLLALTLNVPASGLPRAAAAPGCVTGSVEEAAATLVHPGAEVVSLDAVAGLQTALVHEPLISPAVRHRLLAAGAQWCDTSGFNQAWQAWGGPPDPLTIASAFAQVAAAPYFDGVTVTSRRQLAPGVVALETHARTNGVVADWTITTDDIGVVAASWTATAFAEPPFEAQPRGLTALPGATRDYTRLPTGAVALVGDLLPPVDPQPGPYTDAETPDEFTIRVSLGDTTVSPNPGQDTGVDRLDLMRFTRDVSLENYKQFYNWGLRKGWAPEPHFGQEDLGYVHIDSAITAVCFACVWIREDFQIHISSNVVAILEALGWQYPDEKLAYSNVIGHEMVHNFQHAYYKPEENNRSAHVSFVEGTARFSETVHAYSHVSHQPDSLIYSVGREDLPFVSLAANSCNGWQGSNPDATFANGPFDGKTYNACYFWMTWHQTHGAEGMAELFEAMFDAVAAETGYRQVHHALEQVVGVEGFADDLAVFARATITQRGYVYPAGDGTGEALDWAEWLQDWTPQTLLLGEQRSVSLGSGGVAAAEVFDDAVVTLDAPEQVALYLITDDGEEATEQAIEPGEEIAAPPPGTRHWVVAVNPVVERAAATLGLVAP